MFGVGSKVWYCESGTMRIIDRGEVERVDGSSCLVLLSTGRRVWVDARRLLTWKL